MYIYILYIYTYTCIYVCIYIYDGVLIFIVIGTLVVKVYSGITRKYLLVYHHLQMYSNSFADMHVHSPLQPQASRHGSMTNVHTPHE